MARFDYDFFVIGAGSGGVRAARIAGRHGARVAIAEERYFGGTCVNVGCIPKKLLVCAAHFRDDFEDAAGFGWTVKPSGFSWRTLIENKNVEIARLNGVYKRVLEAAQVAIFEARATLLDRHTIVVGDRKVTAGKILIATGGWPTVPNILGKEHVITSNEAFFLDEMPKRALIVGGGYIAVEFAGILFGLGAKVTQIYRGSLFLRGFDEDVRRHLAEEYVRRGIDLRSSTNVVEIAKRSVNGSSEYTVDLTDESSLDVDLVLYATGRRPRTQGLGLEQVGVRLTPSGAISIDEAWETSVPNIYAIGDVTDRIKLTPVAVNEGHVLADRLFGPAGRHLSYENVPTAVFSTPPIGTVGLTEAQARERYGDVHVYKTSFRPLRHTLSGRNEHTFMKLVVEPKSDRVLGVHMVGAEAGEIVQGFAVALKCGATKAQFDSTVGIHPTAAEEFVTMRDRYVPKTEATN
ncbi:MAG: glutathione-disulfide reductase [Alphaproteobacteria bacterium]|nr:glutathione-disulfide reductase [Alphaproteobacteria bacterium]